MAHFKPSFDTAIHYDEETMEMMMRQHNIFSLLSMTIAGTLMVSSSSTIARDYFDPGLLSLNDDQAVTPDLSIFETAGTIPPGSYTVTLWVNQEERGLRTLVFKSDGQGGVIPELTPDLLHQEGVNTDFLPTFSGLPKNKPINSLSALIPDARIKFNFNQLRLEISIPQIAMQTNTQGMVDPALWDDGIPALLFNYNLNGGRNWLYSSTGRDNGVQTNLFGTLQGGANLQAWRLRSTLTFVRNNSKIGSMASQTTQSSNFSHTYLSRDIRALQSEIVFGESTTNGDVFDSVPFRGVSLGSNEEMLPNSLRGFAPVITGIAQSNARVTVSQNGNAIYQTYVAPGPFRIDDLYQASQGGNLTVTITESDGRVHTQDVAYSSLPVMRRPGSLKYATTVGRYHGGLTEGSRKATFVQGTAIYGLPNNMTLYGGGLVATDYSSAVAGSGISLGYFGALSADITLSRAKLPGLSETQQGTSYRLRYAKSLLETGTSVDLAAYRYSTSGYYNFADFNHLGFRLRDGEVPWALERQRSTLQLRLNQQLHRWGSVYFSAARNDYWNSERVVNTVSSGYSGSYRGVTYSVAYSINRMKGTLGDWPENRQVIFNAQIPMSLFSTAPSLNRFYASYQVTHNNQGQVQQQTGISGSALDDRLSFNMMQGWSNGQNHSTSTLNAGYHGSQGTVNGGYSYSVNNRSLNVGANGGVLIHSGGVTFSRMLGNSAAVVNAFGAGATQVMNGGNIWTDSRGYAVVPYLSNYQTNSIGLNTATLPDDVDLTQSTVKVYPTKGAVVKADFATRKGYQFLATLLQQDKKSVPFGALVTVDNPSGHAINTGIVGDDGQVYLSGLAEQGVLLVKWGRDDAQQCYTAYNLAANPEDSLPSPIRTLTLQCARNKS